MRKVLIFVLALALVPALAAADDLSAELSGGGGQGLASIRTGSGSVSYSILTFGIGNITGAQIRQGNNVVVDLGASSSNGAATGTAATGADLGAIDDNPGNYSVTLQGSSGSVSGTLQNAGGGDGGPVGEAGTLAFGQGVIETTGDVVEVSISVVRTGGSDGAVSVSYATSDGKATAGFDYTTTNGTLSWADGDSAAKQITVPILGDSEVEPFENFFVTLSSPTGGAVLGTPTTAEVQIFEAGEGACDDSVALCLNDDRFEVRAAFETQAGERGPATPFELTDDTGYFWFFRESNVEMVIKVLDGCVQFDTFLVFAGGLTNVEVDITVRDTVSGQVNYYSNPQRTAFQPIQDNDAFQTCP